MDTISDNTSGTDDPIRAAFEATMRETPTARSSTRGDGVDG